MNIKALIVIAILTYTASVAAGDVTTLNDRGVNQHKPLQVASINDDYFRFTAINNFLDAEVISKLISEEKQPSETNRDFQPIEIKNNPRKMEIRDEPLIDRDLK